MEVKYGKEYGSYFIMPSIVEWYFSFPSVISLLFVTELLFKRPLKLIRILVSILKFLKNWPSDGQLYSLYQVVQLLF